MTVLGIDASRAVLDNPTGTELYSLHLIQAMLEQENKSRFRLYLRTAPDGPTFRGAELRAIPFPRFWTHVRLSWELLRHPPDLLFVPAHVLPLAHPRLSLVTIHDLGYRYFPGAHTLRQRLYLDWSTRWSARAATHLLADSQTTRDDLLAHYGTPLDKVTVAYPGYDETLAPVRDPAAIAAVKVRYGIAGDYLLYLGTLQPRKNLVRLVDALAQALPHLPAQTQLVLAGRRGWLTDELFARVRQLGLEGRVLLPGYVPEQDKAALLSGALAFVFPSLYEGFGLPVLEAQACGCPVLCANTSSLPEAAGAGALTVDPLDTRALAEALARLAGDALLRAGLVERGHANLRRFSWRQCAQTVLTVIERLLESKQ